MYLRVYGVSSGLNTLGTLRAADGVRPRLFALDKVSSTRISAHHQPILRDGQTCQCPPQIIGTETHCCTGTPDPHDLPVKMLAPIAPLFAISSAMPRWC